MVPILLVSTDKKSSTSFIEEFVEKNNIASSDIYYVEPEDGLISVEQIRSMQKHIALASPHQRLVVLWSFDLVSIDLQHRLLKTLEEDSARIRFILVSSIQDAVLSTIRSRVQIVNISSSRFSLTDEELKQYDTLFSQLRQGYGFLSNSAIPKKKEEAVLFIDRLTAYMHLKMSKEMNPHLVEGIKKAFTIKRQVLDANAQPQLALDNLLIFIHKSITMK